MRTVRTKVYKFNELSEQAKQKAIDTFKSNDNGFNFYAEDICNSAMKTFYLDQTSKCHVKAQIQQPYQN